MKTSSLVAGLKAAAGRPVPAAVSPEPVAVERQAEQPRSVAVGSAPPRKPKRIRKRAMSGETVMVGGHFSPEVRRTLLLVQAERVNAGKNMKMLLGEAINDLCAKYGKPQPYGGDE